jgi:catechol 2,3-dioxygenase
MSSTAGSGTAPSIASATTVGPVALTVPDLARSRDFYETVLGLHAAAVDDGSVALASAGGDPLIQLHPDPAAPRHDPRAPGLFHVALLFPTRRDLAHALLRVAAARYPLAGASDHLVSEAVYLSDPDGNGIELYRDRPREDWRHDGSGSLQMATLPLDLRDLVAEAGGETVTPDAVPPAGTHVGHVHLQVSDIPQAEAFYHGLLGFDVVVRSYPGALFVSAGGYHHHLGLNTWNSAGAAPPAPGAAGLRWFEIAVPDGDELERIAARLRDADVLVAPAPTGPGALLARDPFGNSVLLRAA